MTRRDLLSSATVMALPTAEAGQAPEWVQLTPVSAGPFDARDGRHYVIKDANAVLAASMKHFGGDAGRLVIDRNHGTDLAAKQGHDAPAAGWIDRLAAQGPNGEPGIWGHVEWTAKGRESVSAREYGFISPVLFSKKAGNELVAIGRASLTNDPALVMKGLFSLQENNTVDFTKIAAALGLPATATEDDIIAAIKAMANEETGEPALNAKATKQVLEAAGVALPKAGERIADDVVVALCAKLKAPKTAGDAATVATLTAKVDELQVQLLSMRSETATNTATTMVDDAIKVGKVTPAERDWAIDYCSREPKKFAELVGLRPQILASGRVAPELPKDGKVPLDDDQKALCAQMGVKEEDFIAELNSKQEAA